MLHCETYKVEAERWGKGGGGFQLQFYLGGGLIQQNRALSPESPEQVGRNALQQLKSIYCQIVIKSLFIL